MQIFVLSADARESAEMHCKKHSGKMILEAVQMLYTAMHILGLETPLCAADDPSRFLTPYKPTHRHHPCVLWLCGARAHVDWLIALALSLGRFCPKHKSLEHVRAMKHAKCFAQLPDTCTTLEWEEQLRNLHISEKSITSCMSRVASINPPMGCKFGVVCIDIDDEFKRDIFVSINGTTDLTATYKRFYVYKAKFKFFMEWHNQGSNPPCAFGDLFDRVFPDLPLLKNEVVAKKRDREAFESDAA